MTSLVKEGMIEQLTDLNVPGPSGGGDAADPGGHLRRISPSSASIVDLTLHCIGRSRCWLALLLLMWAVVALLRAVGCPFFPFRNQSEWSQRLTPTLDIGLSANASQPSPPSSALPSACTS
jgi:hypothetical protein